MSTRVAAVLATVLVLPAVTALAQTKPPVAQFWMDVATNSMSIPGMGDMESGEGALFGGMFGGTKMGGGSPGKWLDTALYTRQKPSGSEGTHAIPPSLGMGSSLPLIPVVAVRSAGDHEGGGEKPKGKLVFYWGCGERVRPGQPKVVDFSRSGPDEWSRFMAGRFAPDRGAKAVPGRSVWPNERDRQRVPNSSSLEGDHAVSGDGVPAGLRFSLRDAYDFMPKINMSTAGDPKASVNVSWQSINAAQGYFLTAMGARGEEEMIIWSSSEEPDPGWGLMDYVSPAQVKKLVNEKVVLAPSIQNCAIPAGIFGAVEGAMVRMIAYGPELNLAQPPRPANPDWAVRVRVKSTGMTMLGMDEKGGGRRSSGRSQDSSSPQETPGVGTVLKGLFGL
ncbi:hypothetical protein [Propionivibrio sp.]|uniref:hypothetical protein n=1 Tax=Propionivibrio sp. TaxID=2212460 RepID=UPI003BF3296A